MQKDSCCASLEQTRKGIRLVRACSVLFEHVARQLPHLHVTFGLRVEENMTCEGGGARHVPQPVCEVCEIFHLMCVFFKKQRADVPTLFFLYSRCQ